jgi:hypothetical protein
MVASFLKPHFSLLLLLLAATAACCAAAVRAGLL